LRCGTLGHALPFRPLHLEAAAKVNLREFIEKPLFVDIPGCHKVKNCSEMARQRDLGMVVDLQLIYETGYQLLKQKIEGGYWRYNISE
tara:strand:+ start:136282 stop:136545 length:264 start_codon:yes stop_codon:yes gene_type:complete